MKYVLSIVLYIIGLIGFLFLGISVITVTYLFKPRQYDKFVKWLCRLFLRSMFIRVKTEGLEKIDPQKSYIFMSNHVNIFDVFLLYGYIPNFARGVELEKHFSWPIWGKVTTRFGNIPISQNKLLSAIKSLQRAETAFKSGTSIIILPEGHRTRDGNLLPFMRGPFLLVQKTKADIVPLAMIGTYEVKKVTHWLVKPGKIKLVTGDIIKYDTVKEMSTKELRDYVREKFLQLIDEHS